MRGSLALVLVMACGRLGFSNLDDVSDASQPPDGVATVGACRWRTTAPDPLTFTGTTIDYPQFTVYQGIGGMPISLLDATTQQVLGSAVSSLGSDTAGAYSVQITGGIAHPLEIELGNVNGFYATHQYYGGFVDQDIAGYLSPVWNAGAMGAVYNTINSTYTQRNGFGTLTIQLEHCDGTFIGSGQVTVDPAPDVLAYLGSNAQPSGTDMTESTYGSVVGFNMPASTSVTITATAPNLTFSPATVPVYAGSNVTVIVMYGN
jgi:hypothetical protein